MKNRRRAGDEAPPHSRRGLHQHNADEFGSLSETTNAYEHRRRRSSTLCHSLTLPRKSSVGTSYEMVETRDANNHHHHHHQTRRSAPNTQRTSANTGAKSAIPSVNKTDKMPANSRHTASPRRRGRQVAVSNDDHHNEGSHHIRGIPRSRTRSAERRAKRAKERANEDGDSDDDSAEAEGTALMLKIGRAFLARVIFVVHSLITIWQTVEAYNNPAYWGFALISVSILLEGGYTIIIHSGDERKWFCPSVLLYVLCTGPSIWALELDMSRYRLMAMNITSTATTKPPTHASRIATQEVEGLALGHEFSVQFLEQLLLVILIIGRWLLPKGEISREQLSQILLAYLAISSDIVELFDVFKEPEVVMHSHLQYMVLTCWFLSLLQFPFVLTVSKARKMRVAITHTTSFEDLRRLQARSERGETSVFSQIIRDIDLWAIILANMFQDVPFLIARLVLMVGYSVVTYTMIFFTCKNLLVIMLQSYRASVIIHDRYERQNPEDDARRLIQHYTESIIHCNEMLAELQMRHSDVYDNFTQGAMAHMQRLRQQQIRSEIHEEHDHIEYVQQQQDRHNAALSVLGTLKMRAQERAAERESAAATEQSEPLLATSGGNCGQPDGAYDDHDIGDEHVLLTPARGGKHRRTTQNGGDQNSLDSSGGGAHPDGQRRTGASSSQWHEPDVGGSSSGERQRSRARHSRHTKNNISSDALDRRSVSSHEMAITHSESISGFGGFAIDSPPQSRHGRGTNRRNRQIAARSSAERGMRRRESDLRDIHEVEDSYYREPKSRRKR